MKKTLIRILAACMVLSLAACTPTTEKRKTGETAETTAAVVKSTLGQGVAYDRQSDRNEPKLDIVSIYTVKSDRSDTEGTMDSVDTPLEAQKLVDLLIQYGVLDEGTTVLSYDMGGDTTGQVVGPGITVVQGFELGNTTLERGTLDLDQFPDDPDGMTLQAVSDTFIENMEILYFTISVNGEVIGEDLTFVGPGSQVQ